MGSECEVWKHLVSEYECYLVLEDEKGWWVGYHLNLQEPTLGVGSVPIHMDGTVIYEVCYRPGLRAL